MKMFLRLLKYLLRYKKPLIFSISLGFFASILNIFNIFAFKPILEIMFSGRSESAEVIQGVVEQPEEEEGQYELPIISWVGKKLRPYREAIDERVTNLTRWSVNHKMKAIYIIGFIVAISGLLRAVTTYGSDYLMIFVGMSLVKDLRYEVHSHILKMDLPFFGRLSTGQLLARSSSDIQTMNSAITSVMDVGIQSPITIIMTMALLFYLSPEMTLYAILVVPVVAIFIGLFGKSIRKISKRAQEHIADVVEVMQETYDGIRVVKAFGMEDYESERLKKANERAFRSFMKRQSIRKIISPLMEFLGIFAAALVLVGGAHLIIREETLTASDFFVFLIAVSRLYRPVKDLSRIHVQIQSGMAGADRVFEILDTESVINEKPDAKPMPPVKEGIDIDHVSFTYVEGYEPALKDINAFIPHGNVVAIVGVSGSGKSTLANLICRFYDPTEGRIKVDGTDMRDFTFDSIRERISIVTQEIILFNDTVRNNIAYGRKDIPLEQIEEAARQAYAHDFIKKMPNGYDSQIGYHGSRLSGGQRQRISIARAILKNPDILVFDEATSSLDSEAEAEIQKAMENLIHGRITILIAHRLSTVKMADEILVLEDGYLRERGNHSQLLAKNGIYAGLCQKQGIFVDLDTYHELQPDEDDSV